MELTIEGKKRPEGSKPNALRREGHLPAVLYGHNGAESVSLVLNKKEAETLVKKASLNNTLIQLNVADLSWNGKALLREVQKHPWKGSIYHLSFFSVSEQASLQVTVPLHFVGVPVGVKQDGGSLDTVLNGLEIACAPNRIPEFIEVDVSNLRSGDSLHVNQLNLPEGATVMGEPDRVVAIVLGGAAGAGDESAEA
ncbi:MAG TPA: 50S ribosomal protein L25/general stress protein Ctc [Trichocoleus sp.]|jgi:large subunit ribosomal protein L25